MTMKITLLNIFATISLAVVVVRAQGPCGDLPVTWRNSNSTCPARAICADVFVSFKNLDDGTQCELRRIHHNCMCPGGSICPYNDPEHLLYATAQQLQFTCQSACQLPFCGNIRSTQAVSQTTLQSSPKFGGRTYTRADCRCPRHHVPYGSTRAVHALANRFNTRQSTEYVCSTGDDEDVMADPCDM